jgi:outer membrane protein OmpA-like peptidoglycan-associated protein
MRLRFLQLCPLAIGLACHSLPGRAALDGPVCEAIRRDIVAARQAKDVERLGALISRAQANGGDCSERTVLCLGRSVALAYVERAYAAADAGGDAQAVEAILAEGKSFGAPWPLLSMLGDIDFDRAAAGDKALYLEAALSLEGALNDLAGETPCAGFGEPAAPAPVEIGRMVKRAAEAKLLAPSFRLARTRDGECGGVFLTSIRGFEPKSTPLPIEFEFNAVAFTQKGEQAAGALLECLGKERFSAIKLSGHTDKVGSDAFNMDLSARRLAVVKDYLVRGGFSGRVVLAPMGKREPFSVDDPSQHSEDEINQLNRRVELREATR